MQQKRGLLNCPQLAGSGTARVLATAIGISAFLLAGAGQPASAGTLCVKPGGTSGCFASIGAAVTAASAGDTIRVAVGT
jgi:hypothetical protein